MTRTEFLDALEQELRRSGVSDTAEIVGEYEDHFAFRLADGFSEEEIAAKLGDPVSLAGQFAAIPAGGRSQGGRGWLVAIGLGFADLFVGCFFVLFACLAILGAVLSVFAAGTTEDGCEQQFALNYLAGYMLTHRLLDHLLKCGGRVIMTGSGSHIGAKVHWDDVMLSRRYNPLTAYKQSKLCDILFARGLADRYGADGLHAYTVDPGLVNTDIGNKTGGIVSLVWGIRKHQGVHPSVPAKTYSFLCARDKTPPGGLYYYMCRERRYSREVTSENADRLFELSAKLCGLSYREARS